MAHKRRISKPHFVKDGPIQLPSHTPKSERHFAKICAAIFAHALASKSVVLLVLESELLKFRLLVLVVCFGVRGRTHFEIVDFSIGFIVCLLS